MDSAAAAGYREGDILAGKYRVERVLGAGGMGVVLAAMHVELRERRAIKLMLPQGLHDPQFAERFLREARALARLRGEHIARVHDVGRLENDVPYMVIEYLEGMDLDQVLETRRRLFPQEAVLYILQACEALAEAHAAGIIHRDLKPPNLFLTRAPDGSAHIKVIDFGIAKTTAIDPTQQHASSSTQTGSWMGSPLYMSPEQILTPRDIDVRADIWALGAILYELLTGAPVWSGLELMEIFYQVTMTTPNLPSQMVPDIPPGLDAIILRCLEKDRNRRWADIAELAEALEPFASDEGKVFARRAIRILVGRQPTVSFIPDAPTPNRASAPGIAPTAFATNMPVASNSAPPLLAASPVSFATNAPNTTSGASKPMWLVPAIMGIVLLFAGIAAYVVWGKAQETVAPTSSVAAAPSQSAARIDAETKDVVPEKKPPQIAPSSEPSVVPAPSANAPASSKPNSIITVTPPKPLAGAISTVPTVVNTTPDKPRPGVIPR